MSRSTAMTSGRKVIARLLFFVFGGLSSPSVRDARIESRPRRTSSPPRRRPMASPGRSPVKNCVNTNGNIFSHPDASVPNPKSVEY